MNQEKYYYGAARVRALEATMLSPTQLARMAAAADFEAAFAVLSETPYSDNLPKLKSPFDFDELFELELVALKNLMQRLAPDNIIITTLFEKYDFLNLKIILKSILAGRSNIEPTAKAGTIDPEKIKLYLAEGAKTFEHQVLREAADQAKLSYESSQDPQTIDLTIDRYYFTHLKKISRLSPSPLLHNLVNHYLDLTNIKTVLRARQRQKDKKYLAGALIEAGLIGHDILLSLLDKEVQEISAKLNYTVYFPELAPGFEYFSETKSFSLLEKLMDDFILSQFSKAKYLNAGLEPLIGYYLAKENEIKTLRFILICKKNAVEPEATKERVRLSYV